MNELKADGEIPKDFKTKSIYISGKKNYRENTHRALCAIYLDILGDGMNGFRTVSANSLTFAFGKIQVQITNLVMKSKISQRRLGTLK